MADRHTANDDRSPRIEGGYGTDAVDPAGWPTTIEEEAEARQAKATAEHLTHMIAWSEV